MKISGVNNSGIISPSTPIDYSQARSVYMDGTNYHVYSRNLIRLLTFEDTTDINAWDKEVPGVNSFTLDSSIYKNKRYGGRFELNKTDIDVGNSKRCEFVYNHDLGQERWYGFSQYFPSAYIADTEGEIVGQWHSTPDFNLGEDWRSPPLSLQILNDVFRVAVLYASNPVNTNATKDGQEVYEVGPVLKDTWIDWVFHMKYSYGQDGVLEVWKNGVKVIDRIGPNCYNDQSYPFFKFGIYKWIWKDNPPASLVSQRVLYYDEVRIGNENATYNDVAPN